MRLRVLKTLLLFAAAALAQGPAGPKSLKEIDSREIKLGEDEPGCKDSALLPRLAACSIIQCDIKENENVELQVGMSTDGAVQKEVMEGPAETLYYLCPSKLSLGGIVKQTEASLIKAGFKPVFAGKDGDDQPLVTVVKDTQWLQISTYQYNEYSAYVQTAVRVTPESQASSEALAEEMAKAGRVVLDGLTFEQGGTDLPADAEKVLAEVVAMLVRQPEWKIRVEVHSSDSADRQANLTASQKRASAVASWLLGHGIDQARVTIQGHSDGKPAAGTEPPRTHRIEIVRL